MKSSFRPFHRLWGGSEKYFWVCQVPLEIMENLSLFLRNKLIRGVIHSCYCYIRSLRLISVLKVSLEVTGQIQTMYPNETISHQ